MCDKIYLDYNSTTPLATEVVSIINDTMVNNWANPSSSHNLGQMATNVITKARKEVAEMIGAAPSDILFTSGGTEANNMVLYSAVKHFRDWQKKKHPDQDINPHIITSDVEHDAIKLPLQQFQNTEVTYLPVEHIINNILNHIQPHTCLITLMLANNETGFLFDIPFLGREISNLNKKRHKEGLFPILFHTDAAQAIGKVDVSVSELEVHYLTIVGHKFYGPRIGALYARNIGNETPVYPVFYGGGQERGYRPGTENTPMVAGLGKACSLVTDNIKEYKESMELIRDYLEHCLKKTFMDCVKINCVEPCDKKNQNCKGDLTTKLSSPIKRLPNTCSISFNYDNVTGSKILKNCKMVLASVGAACHSGDSNHKNSILESFGVCPYHAARTIRLSIGRETTKEQIDIAVADMKSAVDSICDN